MIDDETRAAERRAARRWGAGASAVACEPAGGVTVAGAPGGSANAAAPDRRPVQAPTRRRGAAHRRHGH